MAGSGHVGRFAPSPTGRLHIGSLLAAVASCCDARHHGGEWLVRMEDLDPPREVAGAADDILRTLEGFGFEWDRDVWFQSRRNDAYHAALADLQSGGFCYPCGCSRKDWSEHTVYPGTCRDGLAAGAEGRMQRFRLEEGAMGWHDEFLGEQSFQVERLGDFPLLRADGYWAYQLAVVVDDRSQGVTHVIRGADLLDSTPRQMCVWEALSQVATSTPCARYGHLPILTNAAGQKLSKQTLARPVEVAEACVLLDAVWGWLGQDRSETWVAAMASGDSRAMLTEGCRIWERNRVPAGSIQLQGWGQDERPA